MNLRSAFNELKRRRVYSVAAAYLVTGWLVGQIATQVFPFFSIPERIVRLIILLLIVGFPVAVACAWAFEITPEGIKREKELGRRGAVRKTGRKLTAAVVIIAAAAVGLTIFRHVH